MIRARAASVSPVSSPFGATHRVYLDTPPLKGLRMQPSWFHLGSRGKIGIYARWAFFAVPAGTASAGAKWR
jgi:hypothetical protein